MTKIRRIVSGLLLLGGVLWLLWIPQANENRLETQKASRLVSGAIASMDSPPFNYSRGWQVDTFGADPTEPADAFAMPAGVITFTYQGRELALQLATGDYWGYLYATVDDAPANGLTTIAGNLNSEGNAAGYKTFYQPENQRMDGPGLQWVRIHSAPSPAMEHRVRLEVWRSWGQHPIRAVAVDALPAPIRPRWPGILAIVLSGSVLFGQRKQEKVRPARTKSEAKPGRVRPADRVAGLSQLSLGAALIGLLCATTGVYFVIWWLCLAGITLLALAALVEPVLWLAALLFALPFYFAFHLPLLPGRSFGILDIGIFGGIVGVCGNFVLLHIAQHGTMRWADEDGSTPWMGRFYTFRSFPWIELISGWALVATFAADQFDVALREWRTVFLAALLFAFLLRYVQQNRDPQSAIRNPPLLLLISWLLGATCIALIGLWAYLTHYEPYLVAAEGVTRLRSIYGSPNNLAAYLERALAVTLAFACFARQQRLQLAAAVLALPQAIAFLLTFSKGGIFLGLPAMLLVLAVGGAILLRKAGRSTRVLWGLAAITLLVALALIPVLGAERFRGLLDPASATSFMRINLWRSSWQMALDHGWLGVGPDNFLYTYRSNYLLPAAWQEPNLNHPHNFLLDWWTRLGLPGLVMGLLWWGSMGRRLRNDIRDWIHSPVLSQANVSNLQSPLLKVGLLAALAASLAHGLIDISYALPDLMVVWVLMDEMGKSGGWGARERV